MTLILDTTSSQPIYGSFLAVRDVAGSVPIIDRRLVSRASSQRTLASSRRPSSAPGCRGVAVSASRAGAARAAAILLLSCHEITAIPEVPLGSGHANRLCVLAVNFVKQHTYISFSPFFLSTNTLMSCVCFVLCIVGCLSLNIRDTWKTHYPIGKGARWLRFVSFIYLLRTN